MKYDDAVRIIKNGLPEGFMVSFEEVDHSVLRCEHFPDKWTGEELIPTYEIAVVMAQQFAERTYGKCVNFRIVNQDFTPVGDFKLRNRDRKRRKGDR